jgi:3-isopropylmalate/(R)-2-methylmalate dehydratase large subunit
VTPAEEELHVKTRAWCAENSVELFERRGIGHQVATEVGFATPGAFVVHHDPHIAQLGAFGTLAIGMRRNLIEAFVRDYVTITVPKTVRIDLKGKMQPGVMARDAFHHIVRTVGLTACRDCVLEIGSLGVSDLSIGDLQTITGLAMFLGAVSALVNPDQRILDYALPRARKILEPVFSDPDARYFARFEIDLSNLAPVVVVPPSPSNTRNLVDHLGLPMDAGYVGSCASGRLEDIRAVAQVLAGRKIHPNFRLNVVPTSQAILADALREGLIEPIVQAGAFIASSSCDYCFGRMGNISAGQRAVSTGTLNVPGRMGSPDAEIYIASAASVAAAAVDGCLSDPRKYFRGGQ